MTTTHILAICIIAQWLGIAVGLWVLMVVVDFFTCMSCPRFQRYYGPVVNLYSQILTIIFFVIAMFIILLLWETRSY